MDPQVQASFIPKNTLDVASPRGGGAGGLLFLITLLVFIASLIAAGSVFAYTQYLNKQIDDKSKSLTAAEGAYDPGTIQDLNSMDLRLNQAKILLGKHIAVSGIFSFLASQTLPTVSFSSFDYSVGTDGSAKITMQGVADSFATVALQSDQFDGNKLLKDVDFTGITSDSTSGHIQFSVSATVDPSVFLFTSTLGQSVPITSPTPTGTTTKQ